MSRSAAAHGLPVLQEVERAVPVRQRALAAAVQPTAAVRRAAEQVPAVDLVAQQGAQRASVVGSVVQQAAALLPRAVGVAAALQGVARSAPREAGQDLRFLPQALSGGAFVLRMCVAANVSVVIARRESAVGPAAVAFEP